MKSHSEIITEIKISHLQFGIPHWGSGANFQRLLLFQKRAASVSKTQ